MERAFKFHPIYAFVALVLLMAIMYVSLLEKIELPEAPIIQVDKVVHFTMYFILSISIYKGFFNKKLFLSIAFACFLSFLYGLTVEFLQYFLTSTRMFDIFDIFANGIGTIFAYLTVNKYL